MALRSNWGPEAGCLFSQPSLAVPRACSGGSGLHSQIQEWGEQSGKMEISPSAELGRVQQGSLASGRCQPPWMCTRTCSGASANKLWAVSKGEASELAGAQPSSTAITCHRSVSCPLDGTAGCAHKQTQEPQDSSSGIPSVRVWNVNDIQERNPGLGEAVLKMPGIKEDCVYREAFQCIICVCCEASIRGPKVPTELLLNFSLLRQKSDNTLRALVVDNNINKVLATFSNWPCFDQEIEVAGFLKVP